MITQGAIYKKLQKYGTEFYLEIYTLSPRDFIVSANLAPTTLVL